MDEREFSADSEYRIRFFIAFTVLELLDDLWTSFWPFWPKMTTLWMNNSRTEQNLDMRFSRAVQYWLVLHSGAFWLKSLEPFLRKRRKTLILTTFSYFMDEPGFFRTNRRARFFLLSCRTFVQKIKKILRAVFEKNWRLLTNYYYYYRGDFMGPGDCVAGPKCCHRPNKEIQFHFYVSCDIIWCFKY